MHASEMAATLPTAHLNDPVLTVARHLADSRLLGVGIVDDDDEIIGCVSALDVLWLAMPRYLGDDPLLAAVFDEAQADHIAEALNGVRIGDVVGRLSRRTPTARPDATIVELVELMVSRSCPLVMITPEEGSRHGVVTADGVLEALLEALGDESR